MMEEAAETALKDKLAFSICHPKCAYLHFFKKKMLLKGKSELLQTAGHAFKVFIHENTLFIKHNSDILRSLPTQTAIFESGRVHASETTIKYKYTCL